MVWALNRLATRQGVETFGPHSLRRFYATELVERGVDLLTVQRLMGHANLSTLKVYLLRVNTAPAQADGLWEAPAPKRLRGRARGGMISLLPSPDLVDPASVTVRLNPASVARFNCQVVERGVPVSRRGARPARFT